VSLADDIETAGRVLVGFGFDYTTVGMLGKRLMDAAERIRKEERDARQFRTNETWQAHAVKTLDESGVGRTNAVTREGRIIGEFLEPRDARLAAKAPEMAQMLRELEWADMKPLSATPRCPSCVGNPSLGHAPDCKLASLLKDLP